MLLELTTPDLCRTPWVDLLDPEEPGTRAGHARQRHRSAETLPPRSGTAGTGNGWLVGEPGENRCTPTEEASLYE